MGTSETIVALRLPEEPGPTFFSNRPKPRGRVSQLADSADRVLEREGGLFVESPESDYWQQLPR